MGDLGAARLAVRLRHLGHRRLLPAGVIRLLTIIGCRSTIKNEHSFWKVDIMESRTGPRRGSTRPRRSEPRSHRRRAVALVGIIVLAFAWPSVTAEPKDLPVAVVGPDASVDQLESRVADQAGGAVALERVDDRDAAVAAIERRDAYGAIVLGDAPTDAPEVLVASAASPVVAQTLRAMAAELQQGIDAQLREQLPTQLQSVLRGDPLRGRGPRSRPQARLRPRHPPHRACPSFPRSR